MTKKSEKLAVKKETLRRLSTLTPRELAGVAGGTGSNRTDTDWETSARTRPSQ